MGKKRKKRSNSNSLTAKGQRQMEVDIRVKIGEGKNSAEIMEELDLQPHVFASYLSRIKDIDKNFFETMSSTDVYTNFVEKSRGMIKELRVMRKRFDYRKQYTALVASVKQEHEINKDLVKLGQQLGFIEQKGAEISVESELTFSTMTTEEVRNEVNNEIERLNNMVTQSTIIMRPELMDALGNDKDSIKKYVPDYIAIEEEKPRKKKIKVKTKIKLRRRM